MMLLHNYCNYLYKWMSVVYLYITIHGGLVVVVMYHDLLHMCYFISLYQPSSNPFLLMSSFTWSIHLFFGLSLLLLISNTHLVTWLSSLHAHTTLIMRSIAVSRKGVISVIDVNNVCYRNFGNLTHLSNLTHVK